MNARQPPGVCFWGLRSALGRGNAALCAPPGGSISFVPLDDAKGIHMKVVAACVGALLLAGCATVPPPMSREETLSVSTRTYAGVTPERVFEAASEVFKLADKPADIKISYPDTESMVAVRWTAPFPVHVWYHWTIKATPTPQGTEVSTSIVTTAHGFAVPGGTMPYSSPSAQKLFYARLDYLLRKGGTWPTCKTFKQQNPGSTSLESLCTLADDNVPESPLPTK